MKKALLLSTLYCLIAAPSVSAQSVDILWQGETYTPPFYQGRAIWSNQSLVSFIAITQGIDNPSSLIYTWIRNGTVLGQVSGIGQNSLSFMDTLFSKPVTIKVEVLSLQEELLAESTITLTPRTVGLVVYENNPIYGYMFHSEVYGSHKLTDNEVTFSAFPIFFSTRKKENPNIKYIWNSNAGAVESRNSVTYRTEEKAGTASISVKASYPNFLKQIANKSFLVQFGDDE